MKNLIFVCLLIGGFIVSCKKQKDSISQHDIKGMVFNNCTDSGLANVTVFLQDGQGLNLSTVSGANGDFSFNNIQIHSNTKYEYVIYIPSKSGTNATTFEYCGFDGTRMYFNHDEADFFLKPRVTPRFLFFGFIYGNSSTGNPNDSINIISYQPIFHKNVPDYPYSLNAKFLGTSPPPVGIIAGYPMGKYIIDIDKWVNSVHTTKKDSVYLGWGANTTYTINW